MRKVVLLACSLVAAAGFSATHQVLSLSDHASISTVLKVKVGDTVELPALTEGSYKVNNARVATLDGTTLTIVGTGMIGVQQLTGDNALTGDTAAVLSVPDPIGDGRVFLWNPGHWDASNWCSSEAPVWECLAGVESTESDYPHLPNDIAIVARYKDWAFELNIVGEISLGGLMIGSYVTDHGDMENYRYTLRGVQDGPLSKLTFARTDKAKAFIQICPAARTEGAENGVIKVAFGNACNLPWDASYPLEIVCASDVDVDLGWDGGDAYNTLTYLRFNADSVLNIPEGKSMTMVNGSPFHKDSYFRTVDGHGKIKGAGRFVNSGHSAALVDFDATDFTGTLVEASGGRTGYDRDAQMFIIDSDTYGNAKVEIDGFIVRSDYRSYPSEQAGGYFRIGSAHGWPGQEKVGNRLPGKEVILNGGGLRLYNEQKDWGGATNYFVTEKLSVAKGFTFFEVSGDGNTSFPFTWMKATEVNHENSTGTMVVRCNRLWRTSYCGNVDVTFGNFSDVAIGGILPWMAGWMDQADWGSAGGWEALMFPVADEDGNLRDEGLESTSVADAADGANVYCEGKDLSISSDKTINSLALRNPWGGSKLIGNGRTLTLASGGLIVGSKTRIGENGWNESVPSENCGTLAFGATAYVFANNPNANDSDNVSWIMTPMVAPYGFVMAMAGNLTICGDQTGIDGELVVNAGELQLGLERNNNNANLVLPCALDVPVRIVGGGATLALAAGTQLDATQNVYFDDVGGFSGKLSIPAGYTENCMKCFVDGVTIPRGRWGSSAAYALDSTVMVDDEHFSGEGVLVVRRDDLARPFYIYLR